MVQIVCHKGANELRPENTVASAQLCVDWGVDYVEIDVNCSADGVMYILHGPRVDATTDGDGLLRELTSHEIDQLDAGSWFGAEYAGERVPRLETFLRWIKGKAKVFLDVKRADHAELISLVYSLGLQDDCFFWSGVPGWQAELRALEPRLRQKLNISSTSSRENERAKRGSGSGEEATDAEKLAVLVQKLDDRKAEFGASLFTVELSLGDFVPGVLDACHERGVLCMVMHCPQEKDPEGFRRIVDGGADMVNLDHGDMFIQVEKEAKL